MASRWRHLELWWLSSREWQIVYDRPIRKITDVEVLDLFGDEAYRRRDEQLDNPSAEYRARITQLVSRRVVGALQEAGWAVEADESLPEHGDAFKVVRNGAALRVTQHPEDEQVMLLESVHETIAARSVSEIEEWLLETGLAQSQRAFAAGVVTKKNWTQAGAD